MPRRVLNSLTILYCIISVGDCQVLSPSPIYYCLYYNTLPASCQVCCRRPLHCHYNIFADKCQVLSPTPIYNAHYHYNIFADKCQVSPMTALANCQLSPMILTVLPMIPNYNTLPSVCQVVDDTYLFFLQCCWSLQGFSFKPPPQSPLSARLL